MARSFRLIVDQAVSDGCSDLLGELEASKAAKGLSIVPRLNCQGMGAAAVRANQQAFRPDYSVLIGDSVPVISLNASPDGHEVRRLFGCKLYATAGNLAIDASGLASGMPGVQPWGAVSRVWYGAQSGAGLPSIELYRRWLTKAVGWEARSLRYRMVASFDDHFAYPGFSGIGDLVRAQIPPWLLEDERELPVGADGTDGEWAQWAANPLLLGISDSGGMEFRSEPGLYYAGLTSDWRRLSPRCLLAQFFGSYQCDYSWDNNLIVAATTTAETVSATYNRYGGLQFGSLFTGAPIGDASRAYAPGGWRDPDSYLLDIIGDCSMELTADQLALVDLTRRVSALEGQIAGVVSAQPATQYLSTDRGWTAPNGNPEQFGPVAVSVVVPAANALPMSAYQSFKYSPAGVTAPPFAGLTPGSQHQILCHFCEMGWMQPGKRLIDISVNGSVVVAALDVFTEAGGSFRGLVRSVLAVADAAGKIFVSVAPSAASFDRNAYLCAAVRVAA